MKKLLILFLFGILLLPLYAQLFQYKKAGTNHKGKTAYNNKNYAQAKLSFLKNSVNYPDDSRLHYNLGNAYFKNKQYDNAEKEYYFTLADNKFKNKSIVYQNMGNIAYEKRDLNKALQYFKKAIISDANNKDAVYNYEVIKRLLNQSNSQKKSGQSDKDKQKQQQQQQNQKQQQQKQEQQPQPKLNQNQQNKQEADAILKVLQEKENENMKQQRKESAKPLIGKYW